MSNFDKTLTAYCGLYCGACSAFKKEKCPGCDQNKKATWCKVRSCCKSKNYQSCADCTQYEDPNSCVMFNNFMSKMFSLIFKSDRAACIQQIREKGIEKHAVIMESNGWTTIKHK